MGDRQYKAKRSRPGKAGIFFIKRKVLSGCQACLRGLHQTSKWRKIKKWKYCQEGEARKAARA
jgi:hypothetical protein